MEYQKVSSVEFSKKLANSHSFNGTSIYDGVFSGPTKVACHVEKDYGEIFGGSRCSSSIPVLHVPELNERKIAVDVKSSVLDYSQIFGGFREFEFAVSHDDLSAKSIKKAGSTAEIEPHPSNISVENKFVAHEASYGSFDGVKEFKMSYHKANQERRNGTNGTTHVTQLHAVPGYTCLIDEFAPSRTTDGDKLLPSSPSGTRKHCNFSGESREGKHSRKGSSVLSSGGAGEQGAKDGAIFQNENNHSRSSSNDMLFDATGSRTYPSKVHLPSDQSDSLCNTSCDFKTSTHLKAGSSEGNSSEDATGFCSPTYFEEEVDTNSVAASSAAAVKQAIEEAQARIKIAKEKMERKKSGLQNNVKMRYNDSLRTEERRQGEFTGKTNKFQEEVQHKYAKDDTPLHVFGGLGKQNATEGGQAAPSFSEKDEIFLTKDAPLGPQGENHNSTLMDIKKEELKELKVEKEEGIVTQSVQSVNNHELKERFYTRKMFEQPDESGEKPKPFEERHIQVEVEKQMNAVEGPCELKEGAYELKSIQLILDEEERGKKIITELQDEKEVTLTELQDEKEVIQTKLQDEKEVTLTELQDEKEVIQTKLQDEKEVTLTELQEKREVTLKAIHGVEHREKKQRRQWERNANENKLKVQLGEQEECVKKPRDQEERGMNSLIVLQQEEKEVTFKKTLRVEAHERKQRRLWAQNAHENMLVMQELKDSELMKMRLFKAEKVWLENEKKQEEVLGQKEIEIRSEDFPQREENEAELRELFFHEEKGKSSGATCGKLEFEKQQKEASRLEVNKGEPEDFNGKGDAEATSDEAVGEVNVEVRINEFHDEEQIGKKLEENVGLGVQERLLEAEDNEQMPIRAYQMEEIERRLKESRQWEEAENLQTEIDQREENVTMKVTQEAREDVRSNHESANVASKRQDKIEILRETLEASLHDSNDEFLELPSHEEDEEEMEATSASVEYKETETKENFVDLENDQEEVKFEVAQVVMEHTVIENKAELPTEAFEHDLGVFDTDVRQIPSDRHEKELSTVCNAGNGVEKLSTELEEKFEDAEEVEGSMNVGADESDSESSNEERSMGSTEDVEATQLHSKFQGKGDSTEIAANIETSQNPEQYKESRFKSQETGGMEVEGTKQKEVELDQEHVDKIDIAKEMKKERDKERVAVERAIREARERAFAEAREKAERAAMEKANAEARRRANVEARERLEKAFGKVKSSAEHISMEARLKAERAAVERATAEARMRALEKAMSEKAGSKARNQAVKSPGPSTGNETRPCFTSTDSLSKGLGPTKGVHVVPHSTDKFDTANDEAVQRQKARSESLQRISERAAKALAEKNMRDLLAQKEQAERNRLAEALDADVKRWSRGKAGNLRALLSTLQYILGADSGWQPIPLTDLVTTAAVKKAYRKATLVVHPDKLQQRGASIQQKYTCEKVFDLLKEAWNRFNGEER